MPAAEPIHPGPADLEAFGLGRMDAVRSAQLAAHVLACNACGAALQETRNDAWVERFREAAIQAPDETAADYEASGEVLRHPHYRLLKELGRGGMGVVYLAEHGVMRRLAALKVIKPEYTSNPAAVERFRREIRAAARLHHPNIVAVYDAERAGDKHILVMEYVDGVSLDKLVRERGPLPVAEACEYVRQAALGLQHAHERGLVHRDVKPHNLIRGAGGVVKVLDFGLASARGNGEGSLTGATVVMGTPDYIAPEQAEDSHAADARADIYALGCTLYFLLTGRPPFSRPSAMRTLLAHREDAPEALSVLRPDVTPGLVAVLGRMMAKEPARRYSTAAEVAAALAPFVELGGRPHRQEPAAGSTTRPRRRRLLVAVVAAAVLVGVLGAAALLVHIQTDQSEITIETDDPAIELVVKKGGRLVRIFDPQSKQAWELDPEKYQLGMADQPDGLTIDLAGRQPFVLKRKGEKLVTISRKEAAEPKTIELVRRIPVSGASDLLYCAAVSKSGHYALATHDIHPTVRLDLFNVATGERIFDRQGYVAGFLDDEHVVVDGEWMFRVCEVATGKVIREGKHQTLYGMSVVPGGKRLLYSGPDGFFLYDLVEMKDLHAWKGKAWLEGARFSPDGARLFFRLGNGPWLVWDLQNSRATDGEGLADVGDIEWVFPGGQTVAAGRNGELIEVDVQTGKEVRRLQRIETPAAVQRAYSDDGSLFVVWSADGWLRQYRTPPDGKELGRFQLPPDDRTPSRAGPRLALSEGGRFAALLTTKTLYIFRLAAPPDSE